MKVMRSERTDKEENAKIVFFKLHNIVMHCAHTFGFEESSKINVWYGLDIFPVIKINLILIILL